MIYYLVQGLPLVAISVIVVAAVVSLCIILLPGFCFISKKAIMMIRIFSVLLFFTCLSIGVGFAKYKIDTNKEQRTLCGKKLESIYIKSEIER